MYGMWKRDFRKSRTMSSLWMPVDTFAKDGKKKDSPLSIVAAVLAIFAVAPYIGYAAFILAVIDLGLNNKKFRHLGSWFAIVFVTFVLILISS